MYFENYLLSEEFPSDVHLVSVLQANAQLAQKG